MDEIERRYESETLALPPLSMTLVRLDERAEKDEESPPRPFELNVDEDVILKLIAFLRQEC
ncbi:MAG: hypothetical protein D6770_04450 [Anaerolineae bacterium]|nr:MAG: hypothetical protein D6770_04450 [Anaerolineae bacterium]